MDATGPPIKNEKPQQSPYRHPALQRNNGLRNEPSEKGDDPNIGGSSSSSSSSSDTIEPPINDEIFNDEDVNDEYLNDEDLYVEDVNDENLYDENPQHSPYQHPTLQRNNGLHDPSSFLGDDSQTEGSDSSLNTIQPPINREDPQLRPYPSSTGTTSLQSNGSIRNTSFKTSPSYSSSIM